MSLDSLFTGIFQTTASSTAGGTTTATTVSALTPAQFLLCVGVSLAIGLFLSLVYTYRSKYTAGFVVTLATLPAVVCVVILMVNGNLGAGVAVAGAFSLVRFRSVPGTAKEIGVIFLAMGTGLATGMGYLGYAVLFAVLLSIVGLLYTRIGFGSPKQSQKTMRITIPEDLDYTGIFDDLFETYTTDCTLSGVKTTNMGSLFQLTYELTLKDAGQEKAFLDDLRCRNGNLEIRLAQQGTHAEAL